MSAIDTAAVRTGDAAAAALMPVDRLQQRLARGTIRLSDRDKPSAGSGDARLLTLRAALMIALAQRLERLGFRPRTAAALAAFAVGKPGGREPTGWLVKAPDRPPELLGRRPQAGDCVAIDVAEQLALVRDRLAAAAPELRAAGIV